MYLVVVHTMYYFWPNDDGIEARFKVLQYGTVDSDNYAESPVSLLDPKSLHGGMTRKRIASTMYLCTTSTAAGGGGAGDDDFGRNIRCT